MRELIITGYCTVKCIPHPRPDSKVSSRLPAATKGSLLLELAAWQSVFSRSRWERRALWKFLCALEVLVRTTRLCEAGLNADCPLKQGSTFTFATAGRGGMTSQVTAMFVVLRSV